MKKDNDPNQKSEPREGLPPNVVAQTELDDPEAPIRIRRILESRAYVRADSDSSFLHRDELRHARLSLEYLKTELTLQEHGINSTIVLFGGTRIMKPGTARREVEVLQAELSQDPGNAALEKRVRIAERVLAKSKYYDVAREFARLVSESCKGVAPSEFVITTGGGPGVMEAANRGAFDAGRKSIGLNITLPMEQYPNAYITPELCFQFRYFALRKLHFLKRAKALIAFPGGFGTLDELFDALTLVQTRKIEAIPIVLVGEKFWRNVFNADFLAEEGLIAPEDIKTFCFAETAGEIWKIVKDWYGVTDCSELN